MELINVAILTPDTEYGKALAWAIVRNTKGMEIWIYSDTECLNRDRRNMNHDLIVYDSALPLGEYGNDYDAILVEKKGDENPEEGRLYRYGNIRTITEQLYLIYTKKTGRKIIRDTAGRCEVHAYIAEHGGSGCTSAAEKYSEELVKRFGKKVLFVSLEQFVTSTGGRNGFSGELVGKRNIKQYLYHLLCRREEGQYTAVDSYMISDRAGVKYFLYPDGPNPLLQLYEPGFVTFMNEIVGSGIADAIVIDCGSQLTMQMIRCLEMSKTIHMVLDHRPKNSGWRECLEGLIDENTVNKIVSENTRCVKMNI